MTGCRVRDGVAQPRMFLERPAVDDLQPELVALRLDRHHAVFDPEIGRPADLRAQWRGDARGELGAERGDRRRLRQQRQLARRRVGRGLLVQETRGALVGLDEAASQAVDGDRQHGADRAHEEEPPRGRSGHLRAGEGDGEKGGEHHDEGEGRLPTLTVEGDADERHEHQDPEPAVDAAGRLHEKGHRRGVDGGTDQEGRRRHGPAAHHPDGADEQQCGAEPEGRDVRRPGGPGRAELPRHGHDGEGDVGRDALTQDGRLHRGDIGRHVPGPEAFGLGFCPSVACGRTARASLARRRGEMPVLRGARRLPGVLSKCLHATQDPLP